MSDTNIEFDARARFPKETKSAGAITSATLLLCEFPTTQATPGRSAISCGARCA